MLNWLTPSSMHWPFRALSSVSWPYSIRTIWRSRRYQISIRCIHGWVWSQWDYSFFNLFSDFSRKFHINWKLIAFTNINQLNFIPGSFLVCLCCENATSGCRGAMVPIHASIGLATFLLAIATCVSGLTQRAIYILG